MLSGVDPTAERSSPAARSPARPPSAQSPTRARAGSASRPGPGLGGAWPPTPRAHLAPALAPPSSAKRATSRSDGFAYVHRHACTKRHHCTNFFLKGEKKRKNKKRKEKQSKIPDLLLGRPSAALWPTTLALCGGPAGTAPPWMLSLKPPTQPQSACPAPSLTSIYSKNETPRAWTCRPAAGGRSCLDASPRATCRSGSRLRGS